MKRFIASFTEAEQKIILFVLASLMVGGVLTKLKPGAASQLTFNASDPMEIPRMPAPVVPGGMDTSGKIDVNSADGPMLETLPGIGPAMSKAILRQRDQVGSFASMDDLDKVPGIGPSMMMKLAPLVTFGDAAPAAPTPQPAPMPGAAGVQFLAPPSTAAGHQEVININTATAEQLEQLTGVGPALAGRIIQDRQQRGPFHTAEQLSRVKGIGPSILRKNEGRIAVD